MLFLRNTEIEIKVKQLDFSCCDEKKIKETVMELSQIDLSVLIVNAGYGAFEVFYLFIFLLCHYLFIYF